MNKKLDESSELNEHSAFIYNYHFGPNAIAHSVYRPDGVTLRSDLYDVLGEETADAVINFIKG